MKFLTLTVAAVAGSLLVAGASVASIRQLSSGLTTFQDQNREAVFDVDDNDALSIGDVILGYLRLDDRVTDGLTLSPTQEYVVFATEVKSIFQIDGVTPRAPGDSALINFGPVTSLPAVALGLDFASVFGVATPGAMAANYSNVGTNKIVTATGPVGAGFSIFDLLDEITSEGSLSSVAGIGDTDDVWQSFFTSGTAAASPVDFLPGLASVTLGSPFGNPTTGTNGFFAGLSILSADTFLFNETVLLTTTLHQVTLTNGQVLGASNADFLPGAGTENPFFGTIPGLIPGTVVNYYGASSNASVTVDVIPEPASVTVWAFVLLVSGAVSAAAGRKR